GDPGRTATDNRWFVEAVLWTGRTGCHGAICRKSSADGIPPRSNRKTKRRYSRVLYRTRNIVERFFNRIKHFRRVSTRYDKLAANYLAFAVLACAFGPLVRM
ncbi:transposase, partial [Burkholderia vietnamiensis]|uniref:transposase n=1 Tax=Burkholderia vietnamiensis TaxID=60552 RepID=UPI001E4397FF